MLDMFGLGITREEFEQFALEVCTINSTLIAILVDSGICDHEDFERRKASVSALMDQLMAERKSEIHKKLFGGRNGDSQTGDAAD